MYSKQQNVLRLMVVKKKRKKKKVALLSLLNINKLKHSSGALRYNAN